MELIAYLFVPFYFGLVVLPEILVVFGPLVIILIQPRSIMVFAIKLCMLMVLYLFLRGDAIIGELRIRYICSQPVEYFRNVNEVVELDRSYWDDGGWPIFHKKDTRQFDPSVFNNRYQLSSRYTPLESKFIDGSSRSTLIDTHTGKALFTHDIYSSTKGWYARQVGVSMFYVYGRRCGAGEHGRYETNEIPGSSFTDNITGWVFRPKEPLE